MPLPLHSDSDVYSNALLPPLAVVEPDMIQYLPGSIRLCHLDAASERLWFCTRATYPSTCLDAYFYVPILRLL